MKIHFYCILYTYTIDYSEGGVILYGESFRLAITFGKRHNGMNLEIKE